MKQLIANIERVISVLNDKKQNKGEQEQYKTKLTRESLGLFYGSLGVLGFSLTLPLTRFAVSFFGATIVGPGRALIAMIIAIAVLLFRKEKIPPRKEWVGIGIVGFGAILSFPFLTSWAMVRVPASHGAVELALLPLATAGASVWRNGERPSLSYWIASLLGALSVLGYAFSTGLGRIHIADIVLLAAVVIVAFSYAEGGRLSLIIGGWQVIAWSLVMSSPVIIFIVITNLPPNITDAPQMAWLSLIYLGAGSQFLSFVAWYSGLGLGGVARVSQVQYFQPFFTIIFSYVLLGEELSKATVFTAILVMVIVAIGKKTKIGKEVQ